MIYVSHRLDEVFQIADRVVVLRDGKVAGERDVAATSPAEIIRLIVGRDHSQVFKRPEATPWRRATAPHGPSHRGCRAGELFIPPRRGGGPGRSCGGAGQEAVGAALFGLTSVIRGTIELDGERITPNSPRVAMDLGISLVWGDRNSGSVVPVLSGSGEYVSQPDFCRPPSVVLHVAAARSGEGARAGRQGRVCGPISRTCRSKPSQAAINRKS